MVFIKEQLKTIDHNPHYLNRYLKLIEKWNGMGDVKHHILPSIMFPVYSNLRKNKWNNAKLTHRQHYIIHWILWKAFPKTSSMHKAFWAMTNKDKQKINSKTYEQLRLEHSIWNTKTKSNRITAKNTITGETKSISREDFDGVIWVGVNKGNPNIAENMSKNRKSGAIVTWNKGLKGIKQNLSEQGRTNKGWSLGKPKSAETKKNMSKSMSSLPRCSCIICKVEMAAHHLNRHLNGTYCKP